MNNIAGVIFKTNGKVNFFNRNDIDIKDGDAVIVKTERGMQFGIVFMSNISNVDASQVTDYIVRKATLEDVKKNEKNVKDALSALNKAKQIAQRLNLNMFLIESSYTFDRNQLLFYFLADSRIDFRDMAKELASLYKTRIELRQVGVRDKAKEISGIGQCGRELCCSSFLKDFGESVTINMAKNQNLALNPNKINGQCGRLLCCLNYEDKVYTENREGMPNIGDIVETENGKGKVISLDVLKRSYVVSIPDEGKIEVLMKSK